MADIIKVLPDAVANQIAAGEVIQRPASVLKELVENSVDAGSSEVEINIQDAGKTFIQIIDNGCGMSEGDARICFERHSTSKIRKADDLFAIRTMGFRGEAMASIASIAEIEMKTKRHEDELGSFLKISGSEFISQEPINCQNGTQTLVKNIFFNVPARRKFLKSNTTELKHLSNEFLRIALVNPGIKFILRHNKTELYHLDPGNSRQRIVQVFGKSMNQSLVPVKTETSLIKISGYIGKPDQAKKTYGEQFFFVNGRYMKHPYFHRSLMMAYEGILPKESIPSYFIYFEADPENIDINIHPTKTEIKFASEQSIWQILQATIKEGLGKFNLTPSIDFENEGIMDIPPAQKNQEISMPEIKIDPEYNPFKEEQASSSKVYSSYSPRKQNDQQGWEKLYQGINDQFTGERIEKKQSSLNLDQETRQNNFFQIREKYILTPVKSGLMVINQSRAHERILYEEMKNRHVRQAFPSQKSLYPLKIELSSSEIQLLEPSINQLNDMGFDIRSLGKETLIIQATPSGFNDNDIPIFIERFIRDLQDETPDNTQDLNEKFLCRYARTSSIPYGKLLKQVEMRELVDRLFACQSPNFTPGGKKILQIMAVEDLDKLLK